ncbi:MAG: dTDP-glucose 4,6-dehydratase [Planctomycetes bacterium]|nr:dTDP-glucose 4,6-dehydratase [Planctomycetota bacterium]
MKDIIITGGAGFIGSNLVRAAIEHFTDRRIVNFDKLTYAGNLENLAGLEKHPRYCFIKGDVAEPEDVARAFAGDVEGVMHLAAESHVDRSIHDASPFIKSNVLGTQVLLDAARLKKIHKFVHVSTDEVYGSLGTNGKFTETTPLAANSPYSASKAGSDLLVRAAFHTHKFPGCITRCSNNYGPYQFPEKLVPLLISNALENKPIPVYGDGKNVRDWLFVEDHCAALMRVYESGAPGEVYNIGGDNELENLTLVRTVLRMLGRPESLITFVKDRPGHDRRYAIDASKIRRELNWEPAHKFEDAIRKTIDWYQANPPWWRRVKSGEYREYYEKQYGRAM